MQEITKRQQQVLDFIQKTIQQEGFAPTLREIAKHFRFRSMKAAADHVTALTRKGFLRSKKHRARSLTVVSPLQEFKRRVLDIPVYGTVPAGLADDRQQEVKGCVSVDMSTIGIRPTARTFALEVKGDSMIGKHIMPGDYVIFEHGKTPRAGDVVAALIDRESTLKTLVTERGKTWLRAENPRYPKLTPADELMIQGVMVGLIRKV